MANAPSAEACSALIEYWAKEYKRLFSRSSSEAGLAKGQQIPPAEMKKYIDNYKKWYESSVSQEDTMAKLSILRRISEAWQLNVDTINKLIKYMESTLAVLAVMLIFGCQSGMYQIDTGSGTDGKNSNLTYRIVDKLDPESYSEEYLPVEVSVTKSSGSDSSGGLCFLTLGIIPAFYDDFETLNVTVKTPIGTKSGSGSVHAKKWIGWICLIPYPGTAEERSDNPKLPNSALEGKVKDRIVESLVSQFSKSEYASFVRKVKDDKARELLRVQKKKQALEELIKEGKFEEVIKACGDEKVVIGKENPWTEISERAFVALKQSVPSMNDSSRLVSLFSMVDDKAAKDAVVIRLGALGKCSELGDATLAKYIAESSSEEGRLCAIAAIVGESELIAIAQAKYSDALTVAAFNKLGKPDSVRDIVWKDTIDLQLVKAYVDAFGKDEELVLIVSQFGQRLSPEAIRLIRDRTTSPSVTKAINGIEAAKLADEIFKAVSRDTTRGKNAVDFFSNDYTEISKVVSLVDFEKLVAELNKITDRSLLESVATTVLKKHMQSNSNHIYFGNTRYFEYRTAPKTIITFAKCLPEDECEKLFDSLERGQFWGGDNDGAADCFLLGLLRGMSEGSFQRRLQAAMSRFSSGEKISFEGFYCGMTWQDYNVICNSRNQYPSASVRGNIVIRLVFDRTIRYKLFEKEDGEFWSAYLRKYVPSQKKQKSLTEAIGDALDSGTFEYQEGWDDKLEEHCYIYKSMKYGTRVLFGQKSGALVLEEYK